MGKSVPFFPAVTHPKRDRRFVLTGLTATLLLSRSLVMNERASHFQSVYTMR